MKPTKLKILGYAIVLPLVVELVGVFIIASADSGAYAEGFAAIVLLVMLVMAVPVTIIGNLAIMPWLAPGDSIKPWRAMTIPAVFLAMCLVYYTGFWDKVIEPLLPSSELAIQPAGSGWTDETTFEIYLTLHDTYSTIEERQHITSVAKSRIYQNDGMSSKSGDVTINLYVVPVEDYHPNDHAKSRSQAVAAYTYSGEGEVVETWLR